MPVRSYQRRQADPDLNAVQDNIEEHTKVITESAIIDGRLVTGIEVPASKDPVNVEHKLGRAPKGFIVAGREAGSSTSNTRPIFENTDNDNRDKIVILYTAGDALTIDVWFF